MTGNTAVCSKACSVNKDNFKTQHHLPILKGMDSLEKGPVIRKVFPWLEAHRKAVWEFNAIYVLVIGVGYSAVNMSGIVVVQQYFVQRRALAHGIFTTGVSVGLFTLPTTVRVIISHYAWQSALVLISSILLHTLIFAALLKPVRQEQSIKEIIVGNNVDAKDSNLKLRNNRAHDNMELSLMCKHLSFILFLVGVFGVHVGHLAILTYLPLRCDMIGLTKTEASNLMTIIGIMGIFIRPVMGHLADQLWMNRVVMFGMASVLTGILTGVSTQVYSFSGLAVTSALFGLLSGRLEIYVLHIDGLVQERITSFLH